MARIAVVGAGAIGGAVAAALIERDRHRVTLCVRRPFAGLTVRHPDQRWRSYPLVIGESLLTDPDRADVFEWVLVATKAYQTEALRPWFDRLCGPATRIAVLQNGVDQVERVSPLVPGCAVVPVVVLLAAEAVAPGVVHLDSDGLLDVPDDAAGRAFTALFDPPTEAADSPGRVRVRAVHDFRARAWFKLMMNASAGAVGALTLRPNAVLGEPDVAPVVLGLLQEVAAVGRAHGVDLPDDAAERVLARLTASASVHLSSIAQDRRDAKPLEWEVRNAVVGRLGRRYGVATPLNDLVTALLRLSSGSG